MFVDISDDTQYWLYQVYADQLKVPHTPNSLKLNSDIGLDAVLLIMDELNG